MRYRKPPQAWTATVIFYVVLLIVVLVLDWINHVIVWPYWAAQIGLITLGIGIFVLIGRKYPDLSAQRGVVLAFSVGILTIIPGVLMALNPPPNFWSQYFSIGLGMAAGSFLSFLFIRFFGKIS